MNIQDAKITSRAKISLIVNGILKQKRAEPLSPANLNLVKSLVYFTKRQINFTLPQVSCQVFLDSSCVQPLFLR